ncbi:MAG: hypothetical protein IPF54_25045 [Draconibacterium sp.]|nr:hypothetical protein [Draconibacterium sp.]
MKRKLLFLFVFAVGILVWSCGDDEPKVDLPGPIKDSKIYSYGITAPAGATVTLDKTLKLSDFTAIESFEKYVSKGILSTESYIDFIKVGSENIELKDVTLQVKSNQKINYNLGTITGNTKFILLNDLNFLQQVVNEMVSKKEIVLQLKYSSDNIISTESNLNLKIDITFDF